MVSRVTGVRAASTQRVITRLSLKGPNSPNQKKMITSRIPPKFIRNSSPENVRLPRFAPF